MELFYKREARHNYMLLCPEEAQKRAFFEETMQQRLTETCFLKFSVFYEGEKLCYGYEISGMQPLSRLAERGRLAENLLYALILSLDRAFLLIEGHMLSETGLFLSEETVYVDTETGDVRFCLVPGGSFAVQTELKALLYRLLGQIEAGKDRAVLLCHRLYRTAAEENTSIGALKTELFWYRKQYGGSEEWKMRGLEEEQRQDRETEGRGKTAGLRQYGEAEGRRRAEGWKPYEEAEDRRKTESRRPGEVPAGGAETEEGRFRRGREGFYTGEIDQREQEISYAEEEEDEMEPEGQRQKKPMIGGKQLLLCLLILGAAPLLTGLLRGPAAVLRMLPVFCIIDICVIAYLILSAMERRRRKVGTKEGAEAEEKAEPSEAQEASEGSELERPFFDAEETRAYDRKESAAGIPVFQDFPDLQREGEQEAGEEETRRLVPMEPGLPVLSLSRFPVVIGKDRRYADQVIGAPGVSDMHLRIDKTYDAYTLSDLNSENGTLLSGKQLNANETDPLSPGQEIGLGGYRYLFL